MNHATIKEAQEDMKVVLGTLPVNSKPASVLFDSRASHSFLSKKFALMHDISFEELPTSFMIKTPGSIWRTSRVSHDNEIDAQDLVFLASLIVLKSSDIDIILGMDWLSKHRAKIDCATKLVQLTHSFGKIVRTRKGLQIPSKSFHTEPNLDYRWAWDNSSVFGSFGAENDLG